MAQARGDKNNLPDEGKFTNYYSVTYKIFSGGEAELFMVEYV